MRSRMHTRVRPASSRPVNVITCGPVTPLPLSLKLNVPPVEVESKLTPLAFNPAKSGGVKVTFPPNPAKRLMLTVMLTLVPRFAIGVAELVPIVKSGGPSADELNDETNTSVLAAESSVHPMNKLLLLSVPPNAPNE